MLQKTMLQKTMLQKTMLQKNTFRICVGVAFFCFHSMAVGGIFDFAVDFDAATNPSASGWQYNHDGAGTAGVMGGYSTGDFGGSQMGWVNPGANHLGWAQIDNAGGYGAPADAFDIQNGDVITHAATSFSWTATAANAGNYAVDLNAWLIRDLDRTNTVTLFKNGSSLGRAGTLTCAGDGCDSSRAAPKVIADSADSIVSLAAGDVLSVSVGGNDYAGVNLTLMSTGLDATLPPPPPPPANPNAYYRFEEGAGTEIVDSVSGEVDGMFVGGAGHSSDVPFATVPQTGQANSYSADFSQAGHALVDGHSFIFHQPVAGGADEVDATFEWFMKVPAATGHSPIFWTRAEDNADANRFNLFWNAVFTGAPDSDRFVDGDYRDPTGAAHIIGGPGHNNGTAISLDEWHHFAIVRADANEDGTLEWNWYIDGELSAGHNSLTSGQLPDSMSWLIAGRQGGDAARVLLDEIRLTNGALLPSEFLNAVPEPSSVVMLAMAALLLMRAIPRKM